MDSLAIMLIPDEGYKSSRPKVKDHHLTVAFCGAASQLKDPSATIARANAIVDTVAREIGSVKAVVNGIGIFNAGMDGYAVVDLIDGIGTLNVRALVTQFDGLDGFNIDTRHGFTPHMTRAFYAAEDRDYTGIHGDDIEVLPFNFVAIGAWFEHPITGRQRYEVSL